MLWTRTTEASWRTVAHVALPSTLTVLGVVAGLKLGLSPWQAAYSVLQSFSLGMDVVPQTADTAAHPHWDELAWFVRFALPIAAGAALLEGFRVMQRVRNPLFLMRDHVVIIGAGRLGVALARHFRKTRRVVVVEVDEKTPVLATLEREGVRVIVGDAREHPVLRDGNVRFAHLVIAATGDDIVNVEAAQAALGVGGPACLALVADGRLRESLTHLYPGKRLSTFDAHAFAATRMVRDELPYHAGGPLPLVVIVGLSRFGKAILQEIAAVRAAQKVVVFDMDPHRAGVARRAAGNVSMEFFALESLEQETCDWLQARTDPVTVVLCAENDVRNLDLAVRLSAHAHVQVVMRAFRQPCGRDDTSGVLSRLRGVHVHVVADLVVEQIEAMLAP
jgi:Trk K+ transport system NAD-binding subunit